MNPASQKGLATHMGKEEEEEEDEQQQQGLQLLDFDWKLKVFELSPISQLCEMKSVVAFFSFRVLYSERDVEEVLSFSLCKQICAWRLV